MDLYDASVPVFTKMLGNVERWLDAAVASGKSRSFDPELLLQTRLAPDQFPLVRQVQSACDTAKLAAARLAGVIAPSHPDTETTIEQLRTRLRSVAAYLATIDRAQVDAGADRPITLPWAPGKLLRGEDYLVQFALPNFFFHITTTYAILRHNGVSLGKSDFIGSLPFKDA